MDGYAVVEDTEESRKVTIWIQHLGIGLIRLTHPGTLVAKAVEV